MKFKIIFLFLILLPALSFAQRIISGQVMDANSRQVLSGAHVYVLIENTGVVSDLNGDYKILCKSDKRQVKCLYPGYTPLTINVEKSDTINFYLVPEKVKPAQYDTILTFDPETYEEQIVIVQNDASSYFGIQGEQKDYGFLHDLNPDIRYDSNTESSNTDDFSSIEENKECQVIEEPLSTFSIDVDCASYSVLRNAIKENWDIPENSIRLEEMINYFDYDYPQPKKDLPFSINTELADCPWNPSRKLLHIGLQGKEINYKKLPPSHLVFLLDVSGSMSNANKLPLLKTAFKLLVSELREEDKISIVVYAGAAGMVLEPTPGNEKEKILEAIEKLKAGGSTAGGAGIDLAYKLAKEHFLPEGNNRVILATDGDFNVGLSSDAALTSLIEEKRKDNIFLSVLGFGMGNYKDNKLELLADKGNGTYAYIDNEMEARKVFVHSLRGSLFSIAKDVKIQIEFNPYLVQSYRLVGYENRLLNNADFADDTKDAGELGVGHTVTALYELVLNDEKQKESAEVTINGNELLYQHRALTSIAKKGKTFGQISFRYKLPKEDESKLISHKLSTKLLKNKKPSQNFRFSAAVAGFGMIVRQSTSNKTLDLEKIQQLAQSAIGKDKYGYRAGFLMMLDSYGKR